MRENIFEKCGTTYEDVLNVVKSIATKVANLYGVYDYREELISMGMLTALECLRNFDHSRNVKPTTYIYRFVFGRLKRLAYNQKAYLQMQDRETEPTEPVSDSSKDAPIFFEPNPYRLRPDVMYDAIREQKVVRKACDKHVDDIAKYARIVQREQGSVLGRARIRRERARCAGAIRRTINHVLMLNRPLSSVSTILEELVQMEQAERDEIEQEKARKKRKKKS